MNDQRATPPRTLPDHLIQLAPRDWALWRRVQVRSTGFPAEQLLRLGFPELAEVSAHALAAERRLAEALERANREVNRALDALRADERWSDDELRKPLLKAQIALSKGKVGKAASLAPGLADDEVRRAIAELATAETEHGERLDALRTVHAAALARQSRELRPLISQSRFQEALIWQNRAVYKEAIQKLLDPAEQIDDRNHRLRRREELAASYLQRYCVKNDTIGFFGPSGWGRFADQGPAIEVQPGERLLARREVYLEDWCLYGLGEALFAADPELRPWLRPRRIPSAGFHEQTLYMQGRKPVRMEPAMAAVIAGCRGELAAQDLAALLCGSRADLFAKAEDVFEVLDQLVALGAVRWDFEVPSGPLAQPALRQQMAAIPAAGPRQRCLAALDRLEASRQAIAEAAEDPPALDRAISSLEQTFTELTGQAATRRAGSTYGGRTLVFEDTLRDLDVRFGPEILAAVERPLGLILQGARWCLDQVASSMGGHFDEIYDRLMAESGAPFVIFPYFWQEVEPFLFGARLPELHASVGRMEVRWQEVFGVEPGQRRLDLTSGELEARVAAAFPAPGNGWPLVCHHSPDLMIAAADADAIRAGDFQIVLGELHLANNTLNRWVFMALDPDYASTCAALDADLPERRVVPLPPRETAKITSRTYRSYLSPKDWLMPPPDGSFAVPPTQAVDISQLAVERRPGGLTVRSYDYRLRFNLLEFLSELILVRMVNAFGLLGASPHWPRVTIDRMVVVRESWRFAAAELAFAQPKEELERYLAVRRFVAAHQLPRFVFARTPLEEKPFYVDFESPIFVDTLIKAVSDMQAAGDDELTLSLSEMLPDLDQLWLVDREGRKYSSELRTVIVDPAPARAAATS